MNVKVSLVALFVLTRLDFAAWLFAKLQKKINQFRTDSCSTTSQTAPDESKDKR